MTKVGRTKKACELQTLRIILNLAGFENLRGLESRN